MKHTITLGAGDIRSTIGDYIRKNHPDLCVNKTMSITFTIDESINVITKKIDPNSIVAEVTFADIVHGSAWD